MAIKFSIFSLYDIDYIAIFVVPLSIFFAVIDFEHDINNACRVLRDGGIILYPTDTVWGIGCDARCSTAVKRIYDLKHRADSKAMISLVADYDMLSAYVGSGGVFSYKSVSSRINKPVTLIFPSVSGVCKELLAENGSCGIRVTAEAYSQLLCKSINGALVSTSANISGEPTPRLFKEISQCIIDGVDYVANFRRDDCGEHESSAVVLLDPVTDELKVLRP